MADSEAAVCNFALLNIGDSKGLIASLDDKSEQGQACKLLYPHERDVLLRSYRWPFASRRAYPAQLGGDTYSATTSYGLGAAVSYVPSASKVPFLPETLNTFVYVSLNGNNLGNAPDSSPTWWRQISRAEWAYIFQLPTDVLAVRGLYPGKRRPREDEQIPFALAYEPSPGPGQILLTDAKSPWLPNWVQTVPAGMIALDYTARVTDTKQFPEDFTKALAWCLAERLAAALRKDANEAKQCHEAYLESMALAKANGARDIRRDQLPVPSQIAIRR